MRLAVATLLGTILIGTASADAGTRTGAVTRYAADYASNQSWVLTGAPERIGGTNKRALYRLTFLANPAPGAEGCYAEILYVDSCPNPWYIDDFPMYMKVEAEVRRCGPGWFVVSTPMDDNRCRSSRPLRWPQDYPAFMPGARAAHTMGSTLLSDHGPAPENS